MTVNELHQICNNLMFEQNSNTDYQFAFINVLNLVLAENFTANNVLRKQKGLDMFETKLIGMKCLRQFLLLRVLTMF